MLNTNVSAGGTSMSRGNMCTDLSEHTDGILACLLQSHTAWSAGRGRGFQSVQFYILPKGCGILFSPRVNILAFKAVILSSSPLGAGGSTWIHSLSHTLTLSHYFFLQGSTPISGETGSASSEQLQIRPGSVGGAWKKGSWCTGYLFWQTSWRGETWVIELSAKQRFCLVKSARSLKCM